MSAEKVVKIDNNYENEVLREKYGEAVSENKLLKSILEVSAAEEIVRLKDENKELKDENLKLKVANAEKDKEIAYRDENTDLIASNKAQKMIQDIKDDYDRQLKNAKSNGSRTVSAKNQQLTEENEKLTAIKNDLIKEISGLSAKINSLSAKISGLNAELSTTNEMLGEQKELNTVLIGRLVEVIDILNNSSSVEEARKATARVVSEVESQGIKVNTGYIATSDEQKEFTKLIKKLRDEDKMTFKSISAKLYSEGHPMLASCTNKKHMESKVSDYYKKEYN